MKKKDVEIGGLYWAKISNKLCRVEIVAPSTLGGWLAINTETGRNIRIKSAAKLRGPVFVRISER